MRSAMASPSEPSAAPSKLRHLGSIALSTSTCTTTDPPSLQTGKTAPRASVCQISASGCEAFTARATSSPFKTAETAVLRFPSPCPSGKGDGMIPNGTSRIRALIVDDEPLARNNLAILLRRDADIEIIGECGTGADAVEQIRHHKPDLVFLDVQMPECDGFDVLELLGGDAPPVIIFVTAYDEYALRAFEAGALDYLLKPFEDSRFDLALGRAKQKLAQGKSLPRTLELLAIKSTGLISFVNVREIDWIEAADYYACLHLAGKTHLLRRSITDLEKELD